MYSFVYYSFCLFYSSFYISFDIVTEMRYDWHVLWLAIGDAGRHLASMAFLFLLFLASLLQTFLKSSQLILTAFPFSCNRSFCAVSSWLSFSGGNTQRTRSFHSYGKRWDIERFFKTVKSFLHLETEFQCRSFDSTTAHTAIMFIRYIMLAVLSRKDRDERTICELFYVQCKELEDLSFAYVFGLLLGAMKQAVSDYFRLSTEKVLALVDHFIACLPSILKAKLGFSMCES